MKVSIQSIACWSSYWWHCNLWSSCALFDRLTADRAIMKADMLHMWCGYGHQLYLLCGLCLHGKRTISKGPTPLACVRMVEAVIGVNMLHVSDMEITIRRSLYVAVAEVSMTLIWCCYVAHVDIDRAVVSLMELLSVHKLQSWEECCMY